MNHITIACTRTAKSAARSSLSFLLPVMRGVVADASRPRQRGGGWASTACSARSAAQPADQADSGQRKPAAFSPVAAYPPPRYAPLPHRG